MNGRFLTKSVRLFLSSSSLSSGSACFAFFGADSDLSVPFAGRLCTFKPSSDPSSIFSSSSSDDDEDSSFFAAAFFGVAFLAGASSSLEELSSELDSSFLAAFLAGAALAAGAFLAGASSSLELSSELEDSFFAAFFAGAGFVGVAFLATGFFGASSSLEESSEEELSSKKYHLEKTQLKTRLTFGSLLDRCGFFCWSSLLWWCLIFRAAFF